MNDQSDGAITGLGIALLLAHKHKASRKLIQALKDTTERIQISVATGTLDALNSDTETVFKA